MIDVEAGRPRLLVAVPQSVRDQLFTASDWSRLMQLADVAVNPAGGDLDAPAAEPLLHETELLLTGWGTGSLSASWIDRAPRLTALVHAAGSVKTLVDDRAFERGIAVSSQAEQNGRPVAEYALAMIILAAKRTFRVEREFRAARTGYPLDRITGGGFGTPVGIVGASRIGRRLLRMLQPFDLTASVYDPYLTDADADVLGARKLDLEELFETSSVVSVHAPLLTSTLGMIGRDHLRRLPDGAVFINTARGGVVDQQALIAELQTGRIDAILDVTDPDVLPAESPLWTLPNVTLTPHMAGSVGNEIQRLGGEAIDEIARLAAGLPLKYPVTPTEFAVSA